MKVKKIRSSQGNINVRMGWFTIDLFANLEGDRVQLVIYPGNEAEATITGVRTFIVGNVEPDLCPFRVSQRFLDMIQHVVFDPKPEEAFIIFWDHVLEMRSEINQFWEKAGVDKKFWLPD